MYPLDFDNAIAGSAEGALEAPRETGRERPGDQLLGANVTIVCCAFGPGG